MTQAITEETIRSLSGSELAAVAEWIRVEEKARAERHKQETLAKIRDLAKSIDVGIKIAGTRGRPAKPALKA
jgi:hypothetical protein